LTEPPIHTSQEKQLNNLNQFIEYFSEHCQVYFPAIERTRTHHKDSFDDLGGRLLGWAVDYLGEGWEQTLAEGYMHFLMDVNRSQMEYERRGHYRNKSYDEVYSSVYSDPEVMNRYHWGVYVTTFAWEHHLEIYDFFQREFLSRLNPESGSLLDLGSGSGVWSFLTLHALSNWSSTGIDISHRSVELAQQMAAYAGAEGRVNFLEANALQFRKSAPCQAGVSCFLLEHLEQPQQLLENLYQNLDPGAFAFVTGALTAAEVDHISEFRKESEIVTMAENAGFRTLSMLSAAPPSHPRSQKFLPRSLALVLQKRTNDIW
jgi:2-polyprenyl-3-methyl-5-hydroxy-6-metoxy-1,4-benzoquinol methylase